MKGQYLQQPEPKGIGERCSLPKENGAASTKKPFWEVFAEGWGSTVKTSKLVLMYLEKRAQKAKENNVACGKCT